MGARRNRLTVRQRRFLWALIETEGQVKPAARSAGLEYDYARKLVKQEKFAGALDESLMEMEGMMDPQEVVYRLGIEAQNAVHAKDRISALKAIATMYGLTQTTTVAIDITPPRPDKAPNEQRTIASSVLAVLQSAGVVPALPEPACIDAEPDPTVH